MLSLNMNSLGPNQALRSDLSQGCYLVNNRDGKDLCPNYHQKHSTGI